MLSNIPNERPTCDEILINEQWSITVRDMSFYGIDESDIMKEQQEHFFMNYYRQKILGLNRFDKSFKILENIAEGDFGSVFKVQNEFDKKVFTIKKIPNGM